MLLSSTGTVRRRIGSVGRAVRRVEAGRGRRGRVETCRKGGLVRSASSLERAAIEFRMLGPLEVSRGGRPLSISGKPAALLALLLVHANEVVSTDRLIDGLWGDTPPKSAAKLVQGYVSQLRRSLTAGRDEDGPRWRSRSDAAVRVRPCGSTRGNSTLSASGPCSIRHEPRSPKEMRTWPPRSSADALDLWRGPPLADFAYEPFAQERDRTARGAASDRARGADRSRRSPSAATLSSSASWKR